MSTSASHPSCAAATGRDSKAAAMAASTAAAASQTVTRYRRSQRSAPPTVTDEAVGSGWGRGQNPSLAGRPSSGSSRERPTTLSEATGSTRGAGASDLRADWRTIAAVMGKKRERKEHAVGKPQRIPLDASGTLLSSQTSSPTSPVSTDTDSRRSNHRNDPMEACAERRQQQQPRWPRPHAGAATSGSSSANTQARGQKKKKTLRHAQTRKDVPPADAGEDVRTRCRNPTAAVPSPRRAAAATAQHRSDRESPGRHRHAEQQHRQPTRSPSARRPPQVPLAPAPHHEHLHSGSASDSAVSACVARISPQPAASAVRLGTHSPSPCPARPRQAPLLAQPAAVEVPMLPSASSASAASDASPSSVRTQAGLTVRAGAGTWVAAVSAAPAPQPSPSESASPSLSRLLATPVQKASREDARTEGTGAADTARSARAHSRCPRAASRTAGAEAGDHPASPARSPIPTQPPTTPAVAVTIPQLPLLITPTDRLRFRVQGPWARLLVALLLLPLHCLAAGFDVSHAVAGVYRFDLLWTVVNMLFLGWNGVPFFMGFTRAACVLVGGPVVALLFVFGLGHVVGGAVLQLPCLGAQTAAQRAFLAKELRLPPSPQTQTQRCQPPPGAAMPAVNSAAEAAAEKRAADGGGKEERDRQSPSCAARPRWLRRTRESIAALFAPLPPRPVGRGARKAEVFLGFWGASVGVYLSAVVFNALVHRFWAGQAHWALIPPYVVPHLLSSFDASLLLWGVALLLDWWLLCGLADVMYQQGALAVSLPHFTFANFADFVDIRCFPSWHALRRHAATLESAGVPAKESDCHTPGSRCSGSPAGAMNALLTRCLARRIVLPSCLASCADHGQRPTPHPAAPVGTRVPTLNTFRLCVFWTAVLAGWAVIAIVFAVSGAAINGGRTSRERRLDAYARHWHLLQAARPSSSPPSSSAADHTDGAGEAPLLLTDAAAAKALVSIGCATGAVVLTLLSALQDWGWPTLDPHPNIALPGRPSAVCTLWLATITVPPLSSPAAAVSLSPSLSPALTAKRKGTVIATGASTGWHFLLLLSCLLAFSVRLLVENTRALLNFHAAAGVKIGAIVLLLPAATAAALCLAAVLSTSLWCTDKHAERETTTTGRTRTDTAVPPPPSTQQQPCRRNRSGQSVGCGGGCLCRAPAAVAVWGSVWRAWAVGEHTAARPVPPALALLFYLRPHLSQFTALLQQEGLPEMALSGPRGGAAARAARNPLSSPPVHTEASVQGSAAADEEGEGGVGGGGERRQQRRRQIRRKVAIMELVFILERNGLLAHQLRQRLLLLARANPEGSQARLDRFGSEGRAGPSPTAPSAARGDARACTAAEFSASSLALLTDVLMTREEHGQRRLREREDLTHAFSLL